MSDRRNRYTAVLFLTALMAGTVYLNLGSLPQPLEITEAQRPAARQVQGPAWRSGEEGTSVRQVTRLPKQAHPIQGRPSRWTDRLPTLKQVSDGLQAHIDGAETAVNESLDRDHLFIQLYGASQRAMGRQSVEDMDPKYTVMRLDNGQLTFADPEAEPVDRSTMAGEFISFARRVEFRYGVPTLYVQAPSKLDTARLPQGVDNYADAEADQFLTLLKEAGVDTLDLRPTFRQAAQEDETAGERYFFDTDHHWTPAGAFLGFQTLCDKLEEDYDFTVDSAFTQERNYEKYTFDDLFLGSQGKRVGSLYAGLDDVEIWSPKFKTDFTYTVPMSHITRTGPFAVSLLFPELVADKGSLYDTNPYVIYSGGDFLLARAKNEENPDGKRILILRDSFGCTFTPFLSLLTSETIAMDGRMFSGDQDEMLDYVHWLEPDLVIVLNAASSLEVDGLFPYLPTNRAQNLAAKAQQQGEG